MAGGCARRAVAGTYIPTEVCDQGLADKLGIPATYLRRTRQDRPDLYDANVNGWLDSDPRKFLIRCLRPSDGTSPGAARAFLSDGYKWIDNLDVLLAALDGTPPLSMNWSAGRPRARCARKHSSTYGCSSSSTGRRSCRAVLRRSR
jgi:hypothetical protein